MRQDPRDLAGPPWNGREQDGVASLRDVEFEAGDEDELDDLFVVDRAEARDVGVELTPYDSAEPPLD